MTKLCVKIDQSCHKKGQALWLIWVQRPQKVSQSNNISILEIYMSSHMLCTCLTVYAADEEMSKYGLKEWCQTGVIESGKWKKENEYAFKKNVYRYRCILNTDCMFSKHKIACFSYNSSKEMTHYQSMKWTSFSHSWLRDSKWCSWYLLLVTGLGKYIYRTGRFGLFFEGWPSALPLPKDSGFCG